MRNGDIQSVGIAMLTLTITRIVIERASYNKWFAISFRSFGILFNQVVMKDYNCLESAWTNVVKGFSTITTVALSSIIYKNLVNDQYDEIDTIDELIASNLTVLAPNFLQNHLTLRLSYNRCIAYTYLKRIKVYLFNSFRPKLLRNIVFENIEVIGPSILALNFSFAYILQENPAKNYLKLVNFAAKKGDSGRIMTENLCELQHF